jgi:hypothetical protein
MTDYVDLIKRLEDCEIDFGANQYSLAMLTVEAADALKASSEETARLRAALAFISTSDSGGEIYPTGPSDTVYSEDGNTVLEYKAPWSFLTGEGDTFLEAVEAAMEAEARRLHTTLSHRK